MNNVADGSSILLVDFFAFMVSAVMGPASWGTSIGGLGIEIPFLKGEAKHNCQ